MKTLIAYEDLNKTTPVVVLTCDDSKLSLSVICNLVFEMLVILNKEDGYNVTVALDDITEAIESGM